SETPGVTYEGAFNIDVETDPHGIDIEFVAGPEAGNWNYGVFNLDGDRLQICLDMSGKARPKAFRTAPNSNCALETLRRVSSARPAGVTGGAAQSQENAKPREKVADTPTDAANFEYVDSPAMAKLQGQWSATKIVQDGQELPSFICKSAQRT